MEGSTRQKIAAPGQERLADRAAISDRHILHSTTLSALASVASSGRSTEGDDAGAELRQVWADYVRGFANWTTFITLTFREKDRVHAVTRTEAEFMWRRLVQILNADLFGNHYVRITGHSYFAYAVAFENNGSGNLHMHALVDRRTNWELIIRVWNKMAGYAKIESIRDVESVTRYLSKYLTKGGDLMLWKPGKLKEPSFKPLWYMSK